MKEEAGKVICDLKALAEKKGNKLEVVSIDKIAVLQKEIQRLQSETEINGMTNWIFNNLYNYDYGTLKRGNDEIERRSVIIIAVPCSAAYANVTFNRNGKEYRIYGTVSAPPLAKTVKYITDAVKKAGYAVKFDSFLPLKRLAVQSGLAEYGKNNITFVHGMGSYVNYTAYSSDMPCEEDNWRNVVASSACDNCDICINNCPTGAIQKDRFMINNEICLSAINENTNDFPDWLPDSVHHTAFDCLKCQVCCPMNAGHRNVIDIFFDEAETMRILAGKPFNDVSKEFKNKIDFLRLDGWPSIPRNIKVLLDLMDKGHTPSL
jgi:epoxyqueuosine reductase